MMQLRHLLPRRPNHHYHLDIAMTWVAKARHHAVTVVTPGICKRNDTTVCEGNSVQLNARRNGVQLD
jgi:hypothetical protein